MLQNLILASGSPRRKEILNALGLKFISRVPGDFVEPEFQNAANSQYSKDDFSNFALSNARAKALACKNTFDEELREMHLKGKGRSLIIGADTIGFLGNEVFEKPKNLSEAKNMLMKLQGKKHSIITAICLLDVMTGEEKSAVEESFVSFAELSERDIEAYLAKENVLDKAAAYAIQGRAALFTNEIQGDYLNVVGLPLACLHRLMKSFDINLLEM